MDTTNEAPPVQRDVTDWALLLFWMIYIAGASAMVALLIMILMEAA